MLSTQQHPSLGRWFYQIVEDEEELGRQVRELVDQCSRDHRQPRGAFLDLSSASITNYAVGMSWAGWTALTSLCCGARSAIACALLTVLAVCPGGVVCQ